MASDSYIAGFSSDSVTRRAFLRGGLVVAGGAVLGAKGAATFAQTSPVDGPYRSRVVQARSADVVTLRGIRQELLNDLVSVALRRVTGASSETEAWSRILRPDDVVALKFDAVGTDQLATMPTMVRAVAGSLAASGFDMSRVVAVDASASVVAEAGIKPARWGWSPQAVDFASGRDRLAVWLDDVTAIVNVPLLATHSITGLSGSLTNLAYSVVKHPAGAFGHHGSPYVADIVALPQVGRKLRLTLVDALRVVIDGEADSEDAVIWDAGMLLGSVDALAVDVVGLHVVNAARARAGLPSIGKHKDGPAYLDAAGQRGLGARRMYEIELLKFKL